MEQTTSAFRYEMIVDDVTSKLLQVPVANAYIYIPIHETIRTVYRHAHMELNKELHAAENFMVDFWDGRNFANSEFCQNPEALQIHLYFDEFETVDPMGQKPKSTKWVVFI